MAEGRDPGALLARYYTLPDGLRVCVRLARPTDARRIEALLTPDRDGLAARRLVTFDVRRRLVLCTTALIGTSERIVAVGGIELGAQVPDVLVSDDAVAPGAGGLLRDVLIGHAAAIADARAA